ncbi:NAD(P)/FAD-dependent oxidoreductase [Treponema vincentii]|uniref:NAD(P)/FAD-dependent oxidoreductase n=1 Tax=Treponema vincentii TaxID=69710 RepID=UPI001BAF0BE4|nr:NAD(P)/FAD-dependent oxidoreductase [Treponema vincentii]QUY18882.1 NAD(P)/FAD-dependent oxidoreductase [Treponema vincentii]
MYDVIIIGGGVVGCAIARELSQYRLSIALLEKHSEVCEGSSKANSAIVHGGFDAKPNTLKSRLNVRGNELIRRLAPQLQFHFKQIGSLVVAFSDEDMEAIKMLYERGIANSVPELELWNREKTLAEEPNLSPETRGALFCGTAGIVCPFGMTYAFIENAVENGVELICDAEVTGIQKIDEDIWHAPTQDTAVQTVTAQTSAQEHAFSVTTSQGVFTARYVINAAGLYADKIAAMIGDYDYTINPRKGEYRVLDKVCGDLVHHVIFQAPTKMGKGVLVTPTYDNNLLAGPTAQDVDDREDTSTTLAGLNKIDSSAKKSVPALDFRKTVRTFTGVRARPSTGDFMIYASKHAKGFIHAGGIESPGLSSAPAIAEYVAELLQYAGAELIKKPQVVSARKGISQFSALSNEERATLIAENPLYGRIICRCETVTEAEIVEAIRRPAGARTVDGVKRRVRPGTGRCQGGFCTPRVLEILSRELQLPMENIAKSDRGTEIVLGRLKNAGERKSCSGDFPKHSR